MLGSNITNFIQVPNKADKKFYSDELNYINIEQRSLGFHFVNGTIVKSVCLRCAFEKAVLNYLQNNSQYYLVNIGLLVNLNNIKTLYNNHIEFDNGDIVYYPTTKYKKLKKVWMAIQ